MTHPERSTAEALMTIAADRVRTCRERARLSQAELAHQMAKRGIPWTRATVVNLEKRGSISKKRSEVPGRDSVSIQEWLALADALEVPPLVLLLPTHDVDYPVTPTITAPASHVAQWILGMGPLHPRNPDTGELSFQHPGENFARRQRYFADWVESLPYLQPVPADHRGETHEAVAAFVHLIRNLSEEKVQELLQKLTTTTAPERPVPGPEG